MKRMIAAIFFLSLITNIHAASDTASLKLQGKVDATTSISFSSGDSISHNVNILTGADETFIDKAIEESNSHAGYSVSVKSQKGGLQHANLADVKYDYKIIYGSNIINISNLDTQNILTTTASKKKDKIEREVKISIQGDANAPSGDYEDSLIFTIATNG